MILLGESPPHMCCSSLQYKAMNPTQSTTPLTLLAMPNPPPEVNLSDICLELKFPLARSIIGKLTIDLDLAHIIAI